MAEKKLWEVTFLTNPNEEFKTSRTVTQEFELGRASDKTDVKEALNRYYDAGHIKEIINIKDVTGRPTFAEGGNVRPATEDGGYKERIYKNKVEVIKSPNGKVDGYIVRIKTYEGDKLLVETDAQTAVEKQSQEYAGTDVKCLYLNYIKDHTRNIDAVEFAVQELIKQAAMLGNEAVIGYAHAIEKQNLKRNGFVFHHINAGNENDFIYWLNENNKTFMKKGGKTNSEFDEHERKKADAMRNGNPQWESGDDMEYDIRKEMFENKTLPSIAEVEENGELIDDFLIDESQTVSNAGSQKIYSYDGNNYSITTWFQNAVEHEPGSQEIEAAFESEDEQKMAKGGITKKHANLTTALNNWYGQLDFEDVRKVTGVEIWERDDNYEEALNDARKVWEAKTTDQKFDNYCGVEFRATDTTTEEKAKELVKEYGNNYAHGGRITRKPKIMNNDSFAAGGRIPTASVKKKLIGKTFTYTPPSHKQDHETKEFEITDVEYKKNAYTFIYDYTIHTSAKTGSGLGIAVQLSEPEMRELYKTGEVTLWYMSEGAQLFIKNFESGGSVEFSDGGKTPSPFGLYGSNGEYYIKRLSDDHTLPSSTVSHWTGKPNQFANKKEAMAAMKEMMLKMHKEQPGYNLHPDEYKYEAGGAVTKPYGDELLEIERQQAEKEAKNTVLKFMRSVNLSVLPTGARKVAEAIIADPDLTVADSNDAEFLKFKEFLQAHLPKALEHEAPAPPPAPEPSAQDIKDSIDALQVLAEMGDTEAKDAIEALNLMLELTGEKEFGGTAQMARGGAVGYKKYKQGIKVRVDEAYLNDEASGVNATAIATVLSQPSDEEDLVQIQYTNGIIDYLGQEWLSPINKKEFGGTAFNDNKPFKPDALADGGVAGSNFNDNIPFKPGALAKGGKAGTSEKVKHLYYKLWWLLDQHISMGGKMDYSEKEFSYVNDALDEIKIGYLKEPPDSTNQEQLEEDKFSLTEKEAITTLEHRIEMVEEETGKPNYPSVFPTHKEEMADGGSVKKKITKEQWREFYDLSKMGLDESPISLAEYEKRYGDYPFAAPHISPLIRKSSDFEDFYRRNEAGNYADGGAVGYDDIKNVKLKIENISKHPVLVEKLLAIPHKKLQQQLKGGCSTNYNYGTNTKTCEYYLFFTVFFDYEKEFLKSKGFKSAADVPEEQHAELNKAYHEFVDKNKKKLYTTYHVTVYEGTVNTEKESKELAVKKAYKYYEMLEKKKNPDSVESSFEDGGGVFGKWETVHGKMVKEVSTKHDIKVILLHSGHFVEVMDDKISGSDYFPVPDYVVDGINKDLNLKLPYDVLKKRDYEKGGTAPSNPPKFSEGDNVIVDIFVDKKNPVGTIKKVIRNSEEHIYTVSYKRYDNSSEQTKDFWETELKKAPAPKKKPNHSPTQIEYTKFENGWARISKIGNKYFVSRWTEPDHLDQSGEVSKAEAYKIYEDHLSDDLFDITFGLGGVTSSSVKN